MQSRVGLDAVNSFLAEINGVVMPFLGDYLQGKQWSETAIGVALSLAGLGVFLMQTPAGMIVDRVRQRRTLLAGASILLGVCYGLLPLAPAINCPKNWCRSAGAARLCRPMPPRTSS